MTSDQLNSIGLSKKEAEKKVKVMTNKAEAAYYHKDDSIAIIENRVKIESTIEYSTIVSNTSSKRKHQIIISIVINLLQAEDKLVASSVTLETILSKQSQTDARLDKVDSILDKILQFIQLG